MTAEQSFARKLKELRIERGLSQAELAAGIDLTQRKISKLETLQLIPSPQAAVSIAQFFSVTTDYLFGLEDWKN